MLNALASPAMGHVPSRLPFIFCHFRAAQTLSLFHWTIRGCLVLTRTKNVQACSIVTVYCMNGCQQSVVDPGAKPHRKQLSGLNRQLQFFWLSWNPFLMNVVSARNWSPVLRPEACLFAHYIWYSLESASMAWYDGVAAALSTQKLKHTDSSDIGR